MRIKQLIVVAAGLIIGATGLALSGAQAASAQDNYRPAEIAAIQAFKKEDAALRVWAEAVRDKDQAIARTDYQLAQLEVKAAVLYTTVFDGSPLTDSAAYSKAVNAYSKAVKKHYWSIETANPQSVVDGLAAEVTRTKANLDAAEKPVAYLIDSPHYAEQYLRLLLAAHQP